MKTGRTALRVTAVMTLSLLAGCGSLANFGVTPSTKNMELPQGPPIEDVVTPFDEALSCIRGKIDPSISFAVGQVIDATGKESYAEGGSGKMLSQGAGEMVQTALFRAGVTVVNRRDPNIPIVETQWGIRDIKQQTPVNFYISGSINSLDFIPGGGVEVDIAGIGAKHRQNRILIALDLSLTDAFTGRIVANVPLQKQIFTSQDVVGTDRFFDTTLVSLSAGGMQREAAHFAMRQMLNFATLELIGQLVPAGSFQPCKEKVAGISGSVSSNASHSAGASDIAALMAKTTERNVEAPLQSMQAAQPPQPQAQAQKQAAPQQQPVEITPEMRKVMERTTSVAGQAIVAAQASRRAADPTEAADHIKQAMQFLAVGIQSLKQAASMGVTGPEGDAIAMLIEQAIKEVQTAQQDLQRRAAETPAPQAVVPAPPVPPVTPMTPAAPPKAIGQPRVEGSRDDMLIP